ncbi:MAG: hypothetical protein QXL94_03080 [Candidatus Parvarchaeum sp.]
MSLADEIGNKIGGIEGKQVARLIKALAKYYSKIYNANVTDEYIIKAALSAYADMDKPAPLGVYDDEFLSWVTDYVEENLKNPKNVFKE